MNVELYGGPLDGLRVQTQDPPPRVLSLEMEGLVRPDSYFGVKVALPKNLGLAIYVRNEGTRRYCHDPVKP